MKTVLATACMLCLSLFAAAQTVVQLEYFLDTDAGFGKNTLVAVTPSPDGPFSFTLDVSAASAGYHILYMRTRDSNGSWSHTTMRNVEVVKNNGAASLTSADYFFDTDPGVGKATSTTLTTRADGSLAFVIPKDKTTPGSHTLYLRAQDNNRNWSLTQLKVTTIINCTPPDQPTTLASQTICSGNTLTYSVSAVPLATGYRWTVPTDWTVVSGQGTAIIALRPPSVTTVSAFSTLAVAAYNACDTGQARLFSATINPLPVRPVITVSGDATSLLSNVATGNQWLLNGVLLPGATGQAQPLVAAGTYTVQVVQSGCTSPPSAGYQYVITATEESPGSEVTVFPNPATTFITVVSPGNYPTQIHVYSITGQLMMVSELASGRQQIDVQRFPAGIYLLQISQDTKVTRKLVLKQ
ncbi:T9SS type A sorting domain-containing protein [Fibrella aquatilis]|uniref:T9SS type A sorting domain-containing protein n=1 Tax=Fibrella aquatilis TaxID=2817059 RepID=A0A939K2C4_9BACT|nr:T9SS type A sorting domain-containing protein [Fibrella aquatilis]MBO0934418.1 T9SS type A sorting domain-containing protein [Fibrella aquatilis]